MRGHCEATGHHTDNRVKEGQWQPWALLLFAIPALFPDLSSAPRPFYVCSTRFQSSGESIDLFSPH